MAPPPYFWTPSKSKRNRLCLRLMRKRSLRFPGGLIKVPIFSYLAAAKMNSVDCPLCGKLFSPTLIENHVNSCLSQQENAERAEQLRKGFSIKISRHFHSHHSITTDEEYAKSLDSTSAYSGINGQFDDEDTDSYASTTTTSSYNNAVRKSPTSISISKNHNPEYLLSLRYSQLPVLLIRITEAC